MANIQDLGQEVILADIAGNVYGNIQVISHDEILSAANGPYSWEQSMNQYMEESVGKLSGFDTANAGRVYWYTYTGDPELNSVIQHAVDHGYNRIIVEQISE